MKKYENAVKRPMNFSEETNKVRKIALLAFLLNVGIVSLKVVLADSSGSLSITASAVDSATDAIASLVVFGGLLISSRKSSHFPYGLYKIENILSVLIAFFIFFAGYEIIRKVMTPGNERLVITPIIIGCFLVSVVAAFLFGQYAIRTGKRTNSPTLMAEGRHRQVDVLSSVVVLIAIILDYFGVHSGIFKLNVDYIAAGFVVIFIVYAGWELLSDGMRVLLDASLDRETLDRVRNIIDAEPMVTRINTLIGRNAGRFRFLETDIVIRTGDLEKANKIRWRIESEIYKTLPHIERVVVRTIPHPREHCIIAVPLNDTAGNLSTHFGEAPYFSIINLHLSDGIITQRTLLDNPHTQIPKAKGIRVAEWLVEQKIDVIAVAEDLKKKGPAYVFADAGVDIELVQEKSLDAVIETLKQKITI
ncbi:MAG: cation diffusion facilitator family transporter [Deltaproteobacteria bacterium]|nr:cation diffusion facilitator family transporter [Deltaproteobacteria bacterium]